MKVRTTPINCKFKPPSYDRQDARKPEAKHSHHSRKHEPKYHKHVNYQLPDFDSASLFSGSSQAFRMIFAEESEKLETDVGAKQPINSTIKKTTPGVENFSDAKPTENDGTSELSGDAKKSKSLQNDKKLNELTQGSNLEEEIKTTLEMFNNVAPYLQENIYTKIEESQMMRPENYNDAKSSTARSLVDKTTQTATKPDSIENSADKSGYSIKILLNESGMAPRIFLKDASHDIDKAEALVVDIRQDKNIVIQPLHVDEEKMNVITKQNASTMTDVVEMSDLLSKEKLLASTSHPNNATSERRDWKINFSGGLVRPEKESNSSMHIPPSTDISMAVQVGSMEQANPQLEASPAATRLALLDSYEILASPQKNFFARNVTAKRCNTAKLTLMRAILESNLTDEEKVSSISLIYLNGKNAGANSLRKQFPVQKLQNQIPEKETSTEYETSDTSGETPPGKDEIEDDDRNFVRVDFQRKNKRSKKLRRNRFGKNKFTQTDFEYPIILVPPESYSEDSSKFPKLVKKPLPVSIIPVLRSDSRNSFAASSEDDFKTKPILKKKASPLPPSAKDFGQSHKKSSVTFLIDASTQCDMSGFERFEGDALAECSVQVEPEGNFENLARSDVSSVSESRGVQDLKRERKVSFNTIILTSLFDNDEVEKEELSKSINVKPTFPVKKEEPIKRATNVPPIHKFLDLIDMEAKLMSQSMLNIQNTISTAVRIFKTEAVTLKDISAEVLNKAIKSLTSMHTGVPETVSKLTEHIEARANAQVPQNERRPLLVQEHVQERKILSNKVETIRSPALIPFEVKNSMIKDKKIVAKLEPYQKIIIEKKNEAPLPLKGKPSSSDDSKSSMERSSNDPETSAFIRKLWKDINAEILAKVPKDSKVIQVPKLTKTPAQDLTQPDLPKDAIEDDTLSSVSHPNKPESLLSGPADLRDFWDFNFGTQSGKRTYSTVPQVSKCSVDDSPIASLSVRSDNFQGMPSLDTQSLVTSCYSTNQTHPRFPGHMLVRSFDSTISNIVNLYNTFTSYAYSATTPGQKDAVKMAHKEVQIDSPFFVSSRDEKELDVNDKFPPKKHTISVFPASSEELKPYLAREATPNEDAYQPSKSTSVPEEKELKTLKIDPAKIEPKRNDAKIEEETLDLSVKTNDASMVDSSAAGTASENKSDQLCLSCSDEFPRLKSPEVKNTVNVEKTPSLPTKKKNQTKKKKRKED